MQPTKPTLIDQHSLSGAIRTFSFWVANGTIDYPNLDGIDYFKVLADEPSAMEMIYAIFVNNLKFDAEGKVINAKFAEHRAGLWLKEYFGGKVDWSKEEGGDPLENELY